LAAGLWTGPAQTTSYISSRVTWFTRAEEYTDLGQDYCEERYRERVLQQLSLRAAKLGLKMVALEQPF
jgi:hypothetical protein